MGSLRRLRHRPQNLHPLHQVHRLRSHIERGFYSGYNVYIQHDRLSKSYDIVNIRFTLQVFHSKDFVPSTRFQNQFFLSRTSL